MGTSNGVKRSDTTAGNEHCQALESTSFKYQTPMTETLHLEFMSSYISPLNSRETKKNFLWGGGWNKVQFEKLNHTEVGRVFLSSTLTINSLT